MQDQIRELLLKLNVSDPEILGNTPRRYEGVLSEILAGITAECPDLRSFPSANPGSFVFKAGLRASSICPHHLLPYLLEGAFAYIPCRRVIGISKPGRLLQWVASRLILQEEIAPAFLEHFCKCIKPEGAMLVVRGWHLCEALRGSRQSDSVTVTSECTGVFTELNAHGRELRDTFWALYAKEEGDKPW